MNIFNSFFISAVVFIACVGAQQACPSITITQNLRTSWQDSGVTVRLYDLTIHNAYPEQVSNIVFVIQAAGGAQLSSTAGSAVTSSWNMQQLASTDSTQAPFTLVEDDSSHSFALAAGSTYTSAGYVVSGDITTTIVSADTTCTIASSSSSSSSLSATTSSVASSSTSAAPSGTTTGISKPACSLSFSIQSNGQPWSDPEYEYLQYGVTITNTGATTVKSAVATIYYSTDYGTVSQMWNMQQVAMVGTGGEGSSFEFDLSFGLAPGQSFTGAGFIFAESQVHLTEGHQGHYDFPYSVAPESSVC